MQANTDQGEVAGLAAIGAGGALGLEAARAAPLLRFGHGESVALAAADVRRLGGGQAREIDLQVRLRLGGGRRGRWQRKGRGGAGRRLLQRGALLQELLFLLDVDDEEVGRIQRVRLIYLVLRGALLTGRQLGRRGGCSGRGRRSQVRRRARDADHRRPRRLEGREARLEHPRETKVRHLPRTVSEVVISRDLRKEQVN